MPPRPRTLEEKVVEEILLRLTPNRPAGLYRAALVCKRWCRLISSPEFRRRYRQFYHSPPMLAVLTNGVADDPDGSSHECRFTPRPCASCWPAPSSSCRDVRALDARHGRVLFQRVEEEDVSDGRRNPFQHAAAEDALRDRVIFQRVGAPVHGARGLLVWVPITNEMREVPIPSTSEGLRTLAAAVLCSDTTGACDHLDCHRGPFLVVLVAAGKCVACRFANFLIYTYSSETATWSSRPIATQDPIGAARLMPSAYVGNALYFGFRRLSSILKYDLQLGQTSWIQLPSVCTNNRYPNVLTTTEAGALGLATIRHFNLYIWSRNDVGWTPTKGIQLGRSFTVQDRLAIREPHVLGFADGIGVIFFWVNGVVYGVHVKTHTWSKVFDDRTVYTLIPYSSFYTPDLGAACTREGPTAGGSSA